MSNETPESKDPSPLKDSELTTRFLTLCSQKHANPSQEVRALLLEHPWLAVVRNEHGNTALSLVAQHGKTVDTLDTLKLLYEYGGDINAQNNFGHTALLAAVMNGRLNLVQYLCEQGADVEITHAGNKTPLDIAINHRKYTIAEYLFKRVLAKMPTYVCEIPAELHAKLKIFTKNQDDTILMEEIKSSISAALSDPYTIDFYKVKKALEVAAACAPERADSITPLLQQINQIEAQAIQAQTEQANATWNKVDSQMMNAEAHIDRAKTEIGRIMENIQRILPTKWTDDYTAESKDDGHDPFKTLFQIKLKQIERAQASIQDAEHRLSAAKVVTETRNKVSLNKVAGQSNMADTKFALNTLKWTLETTQFLLKIAQTALEIAKTTEADVLQYMQQRQNTAATQIAEAKDEIMTVNGQATEAKARIEEIIQKLENIQQVDNNLSVNSVLTTAKEIKDVHDGALKEIVGALEQLIEVEQGVLDNGKDANLEQAVEKAQTALEQARVAAATAQSIEHAAQAELTQAKSLIDQAQAQAQPSVSARFSGFLKSFGWSKDNRKVATPAADVVELQNLGEEDSFSATTPPNMVGLRDGIN